MPREDDVSAVANSQVVRMSCPTLGKLIQLLNHPRRVHNYTRRDDRRDARRQNSTGQQRELVRLITDNDRVSGVCAALITNDKIMFARKKIDDLPLGFVAPLQTDNASSRH